MSNTSVSVIIPCYNQAQYLPATLQSVLNQTYQNWECIIVNDGSPDNTEEVALEWVKKDTRFVYLKKTNGGLSDARNYGIKASTGKYILPLDSDDLIAPSYLEKAVPILDSNTRIGIVYANATFFGSVNGPWKPKRYSYKRILFSNILLVASLFRRADYDRTKGYNTNMIYGYEDWDLWLSLTELGAKAYKLQEVLFHYRVRENSMFRLIDKKKSTFLHTQIVNNHIELYKKNFKNPYVLADYFKYRENLNGEKIKDFLYLIKNPNIQIFMFFIKRKLTSYFNI